MKLLCVLELVFLAIEAIEDIKTQKLYLGRLMFFLLGALFLKILWLHESIAEVIPGMSVGIILLGISYLSEEALGYGDGMVILVTGVLCGMKMTIVTVSIAFLVMTIIAMFLIVWKGFFYKARVPFVPCILVGFLGGLLL